VKPTVSIRKALADPKLLGSALAGDSWQPWKVLLTASMGEPLTDDEREFFSKLTGREREPLQRVEELCAVVGRRGGKSRAMSVLAAYIGGLCDHRDNLAPGETGIVLCIAPDSKQASIVLNYCTAAFEGSPILKQLIVSRTADALELTNGVSIEVRAASFRRLRGPTYIAVIADESAFWLGVDNSANPDSEILAAVRPGLATTGGPLILASSPYAKRGVLWDVHRRHFGADGDALILVARGASRTFNPSLSQRVVDRALERDHASAMAEYMAEFRSDIETFVAFEIVQACVADYVEMHPLSTLSYCGFVDPSGGSADSFTVAISHTDGDRAVIDAVREITPPFSPDAVIEEFAVLLNSYRIASVTGDRYGGEFPKELFRKHGIEYQCSEKTKSDLYRDLLPLLNAGRIVLPRSDRLAAQLVGLERRTARGTGRDSIDHGPGLHGDVANAVAGAAAIAIDKTSYRQDYRWLTEDDDVVVDLVPQPQRRHPNLTDEQFLRISQPVALCPGGRRA
jgi:hypothetical protein